jgi:hypothetical protein
MTAGFQSGPFLEGQCQRATKAAKNNAQVPGSASRTRISISTSLEDSHA